MPPPAIQQITARAFRIPTDRPESDGTLRWEATTMVTVNIDAGGRQGFGYTYTDTGALNVIRGTLAPPITGIDALDTPRCWSIMTRAIRDLGETGLARMAVAAVDTALWDLKATGAAWPGPAVKWIMGTAGERPLPRFAHQTFVNWYKRRRPDDGSGNRRPVVLYPDEFNNLFEPNVLKAATGVLERFNYRVHIPERTLPSALPPMHFGFLDLAARQLRKAIALLTPFARQGVPILFAEPSVAAMFKDDLPKIWPNDRDVGRIVDRCAMLSEFIAGQDLELPHLGGRAILHNHCNQKAVLDAGAVHRLLDKMGLEFEEPQQGCCGMAGSFGYIRENYGHSMTIAEAHLLPAVRQAEADTFIVAEAFSCRTQIRDGTSRRAMHTMELLQHALRNADLEKGFA
jgi:hypothetical protein